MVPNLVMAQIWSATTHPRYFLMTYDESIAFLGTIGDALNCDSWEVKGRYAKSGAFTSAQVKALEEHEYRWNWLAARLGIAR